MTYLYFTCLQLKSGHLILSFTTREQLKIVFKYFKRKRSHDFCFSSANGKYEFSNSNNVEISSDGSITCKIPAILKSSCKIDVVDKYIYIENAVDMSGYAESIEWDILNVSAKLINRNLNQVHIRKDEYYEGKNIFFRAQ